MPKTILGQMKLGTLLAVVFLLVGFTLYFNIKTNAVEAKSYNDVQKELTSLTETKFNAKKVAGISNAVNVANNEAVIQGLKLKDRKVVIGTLGRLSTKMKDSTPFKNIKVHVHTKDNKSFVRAWKTEKYGDDLSSFRHSVITVNDTKKAVNTFEVGKAGLSLRSVVPVFDGGNHLGSLEFMQGLNSVAKSFDAGKKAFILLMDPGSKSVESFSNNKILNGYIVSQKFLNQDFYNDAKNIDLKLFSKEKPYQMTQKYFYTYVDVKDFRGKQIGIALVGENLDIVNHTVDNTKTMLYELFTVFGVLIVLIMLILFILVKTKIINRLVSFSVSIRELTQTGEIKKLEVTSQDEVSNVAEDFNEYLSSIEKGINEDNLVIKKAEEIIGKVKVGILTDTINASSKNQSLNNLVNHANDLIKNQNIMFDKILAIANEYKNYNYTNELRVDGLAKDGSFQQLIDSINAIKGAITSMLVENKTNGLTLDNTSDILKENVDILSSSSNEAAASLEETAAALEEITSNVQSNSENISKMTSYANSLTDSAKDGQELAQKTTTSMDEINQQVNAINEAITVIDQISFQTNILSLNAAVEAATAGEAGKGFAVVAQEVRNLASRSAEAANEIKTLVENAKVKANEGREISKDMIEGYNGLSSYVKSTMEVIQDVSNASREQQTGIEQINDAINQLDRQTQQNAAIASQSQEVALVTDALAKKIVENANAKEFLGKDQVKADDLNLKTSSDTNIANSNTGIKQIPQNNINNDEWKDFGYYYTKKRMILKSFSFYF